MPGNKIKVMGTLTNDQRAAVVTTHTYSVINFANLERIVKDFQPIFASLKTNKFVSISPEDKVILEQMRAALTTDVINNAENAAAKLIAGAGQFPNTVIQLLYNNNELVDLGFDSGLDTAMVNAISKARNKITKALFSVPDTDANSSYDFNTRPAIVKGTSNPKDLTAAILALAQGVNDLCQAIGDGCDPNPVLTTPAKPNPNPKAPIVIVRNRPTPPPPPPSRKPPPLPPPPKPPSNPGELALLRREKLAARSGTPLDKDKNANLNHDFDVVQAVKRGASKTAELQDEMVFTPDRYRAEQEQRIDAGTLTAKGPKNYTPPEQELNLAALKVHKGFVYEDTGKKSATTGKQIFACKLKDPVITQPIAFEMEQAKITNKRTSQLEDAIVITPTKEALTLVTGENAKDINDPLQAGGAVQIATQIFETATQVKAFVAEVDLPGFDPAHGITDEQCRQLCVLLDAVLTAHMLPDIEPALLQSIEVSLQAKADKHYDDFEASSQSSTPPDQTLAKTQCELVDMYSILQAVKKINENTQDPKDLYNLPGKQYVERLEEALKARRLKNIPFGQRVEQQDHIRKPPAT